MKALKNQRGLVTVDYLVSFVLVGGFSFLILALSLSLSVVEIVQYATFASARNYYAGNLNPDAQYTAGVMKFNQIVNDPVFAPLFKNGWFRLETAGSVTVGDIAKSGSADFNQYRGQPAEQNLFFGTVVSLTLNVLDFNVPFFGSTVLEENGDRKPFSTYVGSYLGRETTFQECENFMLNRLEAIKRLPVQNAAPYSQVKTQDIYVPSDNGC